MTSLQRSTVVQSQGGRRASRGFNRRSVSEMRVCSGHHRNDARNPFTLIWLFRDCVAHQRWLPLSLSPMGLGAAPGCPGGCQKCLRHGSMPSSSRAGNRWIHLQVGTSKVENSERSSISSPNNPTHASIWESRETRDESFSVIAQ